VRALRDDVSTRVDALAEELEAASVR
jgi:hypothetical protein